MLIMKPASTAVDPPAEEYFNVICRAASVTTHGLRLVKQSAFYDRPHDSFI
jgi:hypothetical protein